MNAKQESKLKMYLAVRIFLLSNPTITAKIPNYEMFSTALDAAILQIQTNGEQQQFSISGVTDNKKRLRENLISLTADASRKVQAYAIYTGNTVLQAETKYKESYLRDVSEVKLLSIANGLHSKIEDNLPALEPYGLTAATQTAYQTAITAFANAIPEQSQSEQEKKESKLLQDQGFDAADVAVANIDAGVEIVRLSEPNFYTGYRNARKIHDMGKGSLQVQGKVAEAATGKPIPYATVTFRLQGHTEVVLEKETADKGGFNVKTLAEGIYELTIVKVGFQTQTVSIIVRWDQLCVVEVKMESI